MTSTTTIDATITVREFLGLFKPRIAFAIALSAIGGMAIAPGPSPEAWQVVVLAVGVFVAAGSSGAFNQWAESDLDRRMARTANRLFASGRLYPGVGWLAVIVVLLTISVGLIATTINAWAALYTFLGAFTYAVIYTLWLKRRTWLNIVIGGLAGSFAVLAGAA
ncbi:MAG: protoheme IX farnesyltransferase, partial [Methyloligellaceae bacterium]